MIFEGDIDIKLSDTGEITFSNTAKELSSVEVEQLFDRFYTVEVAHHSTGLGLSIARTLVQHIGGTITAEYSDSRLKIKTIVKGIIRIADYNQNRASLAPQLIRIDFAVLPETKCQ